jgi:hypothetical protein
VAQGQSLMEKMEIEAFPMVGDLSYRAQEDVRSASAQYGNPGQLGLWTYNESEIVHSESPVAQRPVAASK